jgi:ribosomal protein S18 acetylase RimI-like enzyme
MPRRTTAARWESEPGSGRNVLGVDGHDERKWRFRPVREADYPKKSEVQGRLYPDDPISSEEYRRLGRLLEDPRIFHLGLVAEDPRDGAVAGFGLLYNSPRNFDPAKYSIELWVDPSHQGHGLGRELFRLLEEAARNRNAALLWASVRAEDARSVRFFERSGFVERRRSWTSRLDLSGAMPDRRGGLPLPQGVLFTSIAEEGSDRPEVRERLFRLRSESGRDVPSMGTPSGYSFEQFLDSTFRHPAFLPEATMVARVGERYVSVTSLETVDGKNDTLHVSYTGTLRDFRGRGLATELKHRAIGYAKARGYRYVTTDNDSANAPILRINQALGFRIERTTIRGEKPLKGITPTPRKR